MEYDRSFIKEYSLDVARVKDGFSEISYEIEGKFFEHFEKSQIEEAQVSIQLKMEKNQSHLDVQYHLSGWVMQDCDRCGQPYQQTIENDFRIIYSFQVKKGDEETEIVFLDRDEDQLNLVQEFYDFIHLSLPMRKVPPPEVHLCDPNILKMLGLNEEGEEVEQQKEEEEIDPRWAALKQLKDKLD